MRIVILAASDQDYSDAMDAAEFAKKRGDAGGTIIACTSIGTEAASMSLASLSGAYVPLPVAGHTFVDTMRYKPAADTSSASVEDAVLRTLELTCKPGAPGRV